MWIPWGSASGFDPWWILLRYWTEDHMEMNLWKNRKKDKSQSTRFKLNVFFNFYLDFIYKQAPYNSIQTYRYHSWLQLFFLGSVFLLVFRAFQPIENSSARIDWHVTTFLYVFASDHLDFWLANQQSQRYHIREDIKSCRLLHAAKVWQACVTNVYFSTKYIWGT